MKCADKHFIGAGWACAIAMKDWRYQMRDKNFYRQVFEFLFDTTWTRQTSEVMAEFNISRREAVKVLNHLYAQGLARKLLCDDSGFIYEHRKQRPGIELHWNSNPLYSDMKFQDAVKFFDEQFKE